MRFLETENFLYKSGAYKLLVTSTQNHIVNCKIFKQDRQETKNEVKSDGTKVYYLIKQR